MTSVLVTGASSGIGRATALRLCRSGMDVFAGVRDPADADELTSEGGPRIRPVQLDVTDQASVDDALAGIANRVADRGLDALVNNAGEGMPGPLETLAISDIRAQLEVNLLGQIRVTQAALPMLRRATGRIVFVGSIGGKVALAFAGPYHASKYAIEAVADVWRQELLPDGIAVTVIEPGAMSTAIWEKARSRLDDQIADPSPRLDPYRERLSAFRRRLQAGDDHGDDPDEVAAVIQKAVTTAHVRSHYRVGAQAKLADTARRVLPEQVWDRLAHRFASR